MMTTHPAIDRLLNCDEIDGPNLARALNDYGRTDPPPYTFREYIEWEDLPGGETKYTYRGFARAVDTGPARHVGHAIHQALSSLRSSLELLAYELAGDQASTSTTFPITDAPAKFSRAQERGALAGVPPEAVDIIERLQPYRHPTAPEEDRLWILNEFRRLDFHRRPHVTCVASGRAAGSSMQSVSWGGLSLASSIDSPRRDVALSYDEEQLVATATWTASRPPPASMFVDNTMRVSLAFDDDTPRPGHNPLFVLTEIARHLRVHVMPPLVAILEGRLLNPLDFADVHRLASTTAPVNVSPVRNLAPGDWTYAMSWDCPPGLSFDDRMARLAVGISTWHHDVLASGLQAREEPTILPTDETWSISGLIGLPREN